MALQIQGGGNVGFSIQAHETPGVIKKNIQFLYCKKKTEDINLSFNKSTKSDRLHTEGY